MGSTLPFSTTVQHSGVQREARTPGHQYLLEYRQRRTSQLLIAASPETQHGSLSLKTKAPIQRVTLQLRGNQNHLEGLGPSRTHPRNLHLIGTIHRLFVCLFCYAGNQTKVLCTLDKHFGVKLHPWSPSVLL